MTSKDFSSPVGISCVVVPFPNRDMAQEFWFGWSQLVRTFKRLDIKVIDINAYDGELEKAVSHFDNDELVLVLSHGQLVILDKVLECLFGVMNEKGSRSAILSYDSSYYGNLTPTYFTARGLERFVYGLSSYPVELADFAAQANPQCMLTRVDAIRNKSILNDAAWLNHAFVHDYAGYQQSSRSELIDLVPWESKRVLDVGGGEGGFLKTLKAEWLREGRGILETHLVEQSRAACRVARCAVDQVWEGDFTSVPVHTKFDCISFLDVLEHSESPVDWLRHARDLLGPGGVVLASIPNVGHWSVIVDLIEGRWDYSPVGIHCITHLRFFTESGLYELFLEAGFLVAQLEVVKIPCPVGVRASLENVGDASLKLCPNPNSWDNYAFLIKAVPTQDSSTKFTG